jgi:chromodomain-helicase-DNA-binding protein 1
MQLYPFLLNFCTEATPLTDSDSASDFESETPAKKKKKRHHDGSGIEDFRFSTRGIKLPNYFENEEDASMDDETDTGGDDGGTSAQTEQVHEIEMVLDHHRDDEKKGDAEDNFQTNMVCPVLSAPRSVDIDTTR